MRQLSSTLLAAQQAESRTPYVRVEAASRTAGVARLDWERLYMGSEDAYFHAATLPGDGSLVRVRITPPVDSRKLYRQRAPDPGPESDFSQWAYTGQYNAVTTACCSQGAEVSIFWIKSDRKIYQLLSTDYGASWGSPQLLGYTPTTAINGIAAAYKPSGDIALFFADQATLYVMKRISGSWGAGAAWDKSTGDLSGAACVYSDDWDLFVTGRDTGGNFKLWSLIYGDGGHVPAGTWSSLKEFASAPADGGFEYRHAFMDRPDVHRCFFAERFTGTEAYNRPFWSHSVLDTGFADSLWREPVPLDLNAEYGVAIAHHGDWCWLSAPYGVWRASLTPETIDLTPDVLALKEELSADEGRLTVELVNSDGKYASPGQGELRALDIGCELLFSPGYVTTAGSEASSGPAYSIEAWEHTASGGKASLVIHAASARSLDWTARHQFRWNKETQEMSVKEILAFVLGRAGLRLEVNSQSMEITGFYPDFTINPDDRGETVISRLLSFVPDVLFVEGGAAYIVNPQATDSPVYSYGTSHPILEGRYQESAWRLNRVRVEGFDPLTGAPIVADSFAWDEIARVTDRLEQLEDRNIDTLAGAQARGQAHLRRAEIESAGGFIRTPANCGQQLYDVIDITDSRAGLAAEKRRVVGLTLFYDPRRGHYEHRLSLGKV